MKDKKYIKVSEVQSMSVKDIQKDDLKTMSNREGLILQGCGGDPQEWIDGINDLLTKEEILLNGTKFNDVIRFQDDNLTDLMFEFTDDVEIHMGKLAMWRIKTHEVFEGIWLSDYVDNRLGGFIQSGAEQQNSQKEKPECPLIGQDGNIFNLMGIASKTLRKNGMSEEAKEMSNRIIASGSYDEALNIIGEYVNIVGIDDFDSEMSAEEDMGIQMGGI